MCNSLLYCNINKTFVQFKIYKPTHSIFTHHYIAEVCVLRLQLHALLLQGLVFEHTGK